MKLLQILVVAYIRWLLDAVYTDMPWHAKWPDLPFQFAKLDVRHVWKKRFAWLEKYLGQITVLTQVPKEHVIDEYIWLQAKGISRMCLQYQKLFDTSLA